MGFVTTSDFAINPYLLTNLSAIGTGFTRFIDEQEEEMLRKILGGSLYQSFVEGLAALPAKWVAASAYATDVRVYYGLNIWRSLVDANNDIPAEGESWTLVEKNIWLQLRDGDEYLYNKHKYRWFGMKGALIPFIYSEWLRATNENQTDSGTTKQKAENVEMVSPGRRIARARSEFARKIGDKCNQKDTLYGFITQTNVAVPSVFDDTFDDTFGSFISYFEFNFKSPGKANIWSI